MTIIYNDFALFSGGPGEGESLIRQHVIENDWLGDIVRLSSDLFYSTEISAHIRIIIKDKSPKHQRKVQLIDTSNMYEDRYKNIGKKRVDISKACREMTVQAYREFDNKKCRFDNRTVESKILDSESFELTRVTIERPERSENGDIAYKKNGSTSMDMSLRDMEGTNEYSQREVMPFSPDTKMDRKKGRIGCETPFTQLLYKYAPPGPSGTISERIKQLEESVVKNFQVLSGKKVDADE